MINSKSTLPFLTIQHFQLSQKKPCYDCISFNYLKRFKEHETAVLRFAIDPYVPFTNNRAERDLSIEKVKQKVSGFFRKELYAKAYCRISSYLKTMANKGYNPLFAIQMALARKINDQEAVA